MWGRHRSGEVLKRGQKQREAERPGPHDPLRGHVPSDPKTSHKGPPPKAHSSSQHSLPGDKACNMRTFAGNYPCSAMAHGSARRQTGLPVQIYKGCESENSPPALVPSTTATIQMEVRDQDRSFDRETGGHLEGEVAMMEVPPCSQGTEGGIPPPSLAKGALRCA